MYLQQLITFLQVVKNKSFRRAAEHLCLTQPAISAQIRSLEEELGSPLFHRQPLSLTSGGKAFSSPLQSKLWPLQRKASVWFKISRGCHKEISPWALFRAS